MAGTKSHHKNLFLTALETSLSCEVKTLIREKDIFVVIPALGCGLLLLAKGRRKERL